MKHNFKRVLGLIFGGGFLFSSFAYSDTLSAEFGVDGFYSQLKENSALQSSQEMQFDATVSPTFWLKFEHLVLGLLPNVKLSYSDLSVDKTKEDDQGEASLKEMHYTLYYELFDNGLFSFDLGASYSAMQGDLKYAGGSFLDLFHGRITGYASSEVMIPTTDLSVFAEAQLGQHMGQYRDLHAGLAWHTDSWPDFKIRVGYKYEKIEGEDDDLDMKYQFKDQGVFAGISLRI